MSLLYNIRERILEICTLNQFERMKCYHELSHFIIENWPPTPPTKTLLLLSQIITKNMHYKSCYFAIVYSKVARYSCTDVNFIWPTPQLVDPKGEEIDCTYVSSC